MHFELRQSPSPLILLAGWGAQFVSARPEPLAIQDLKGGFEQVAQYGKVEFEFVLNKQFDNPYDPDEIDVSIQLVAPDGASVSHPGFYDAGYHLDLDHGKEVPRQDGRPRWRVRYAPSVPGKYAWKLVARTRDETASQAGAFACEASNARGFVRVSEQDEKHFEFSNGEFYYPIGHVCRSLVDRRWEGFALQEPAAAAASAEARSNRDRGVYCYDEWFQKMEENGENFAAVWMCPWWCGLEWSRVLPGYDGIGRYNQQNAARLDRIVQAAEAHGIYLLPYLTNHGGLSTVIDGDWHNSPYNRRQPGGYLEFASDFFTSDEALAAHRKMIRYAIARWGYSTAIGIWSISTETNYIEAYEGRRSLESGQRDILKGKSPNDFGIVARRDLVRKWLIDTAALMRDIDAHPHVITTQFSHPTEGYETWASGEMEVVLNNAYTQYLRLSDKSWMGDDPDGAEGVADTLFLFGKWFEKFDRPVLVAEWGGAAEDNSLDHLRAELHTGIWASYMTTNAGSTGFWWWNLVDTDNLYGHYRALAAFAEGEDRRGRNLRSTRARVIWRFEPPANIERDLLDVESPRDRAIVLSDEQSLYGYVFCNEINLQEGSLPATSFDDASFAESGTAFLEVPEQLAPGVYAVEYWDTFDGQVVERREVEITGGNPRHVPLISHRVDLAVKMKLVSPR